MATLERAWLGTIVSGTVGVVLNRRGRDGRWILQNRHPGQTFFELEKVGKPSRWNTLRALRILNWWERARKIA